MELMNIDVNTIVTVSGCPVSVVMDKATATIKYLDSSLTIPAHKLDSLVNSIQRAREVFQQNHHSKVLVSPKEYFGSMNT